MELNSNSKVVFYYSHLGDDFNPDPKLPFGVQDNEVVITL
jgi:hypothetical protein